MPSTHSSLHVHAIFSTQHRKIWFSGETWPKLHSYIGGIVRNLEAVPHAIGGVGDHVHILMGLKPTHTLSDVMRTIKADSSRWIKCELGLNGFAWQEGYGAFSVSSSNLETVRAYVIHQEKHHVGKSFQEEYVEMLDKAGVSYDRDYLW